MATIFERIIAGEIPSKKLYEDDKAVIIMDINPVRKGHSLVIPKHPYQWLEECDDETLAHIMLLAKKMMQQMKKQLGCEYVHLIVEGVEVPHVHIHLVPSMIAEKNAQWHHEKYEENEMDEYLAKLRMQ